MSLLDSLFPGRAAKRAKAEAAIAQARAVKSHFDALVHHRSRSGSIASNAAADDIARGGRDRLRAKAREGERNIAVCRRGIDVIVNNAVGPGIIPVVVTQNAQAKTTLEAKIKEHLETTACDAAGKGDVYSIQRRVFRAVVRDGECLVRRRLRMAKDRLPLPVQFEVLEADFIDASVHGKQPNGSIAVEGIEFSPVGRIEAYHIFDQHPGSSQFGMAKSRRVSAADIIHVYRVDRPGQVRGISWLAPIFLLLNDLRDFREAHLMRQKIAACFAAFITRNSENAFVPATGDESNDRQPPLENVEPGLIEHLQPGEEVSFGQPPQVHDFDPYVKSHLRDIAVGLGVSYEELTGDLSNVNFSSGRMGWLSFQRNIEVWRGDILLPQLCARLGDWFLEAAGIAIGTSAAQIAWTPPRREMISPAQEVPAIRNAIRAGLTSRSEEVRKLGFDPDDLDAEIEADNARADSKGLVFDSDPRKTSAVGQVQQQQEQPND